MNFETTEEISKKAAPDARMPGVGGESNSADVPVSEAVPHIPC